MLLTSITAIKGSDRLKRRILVIASFLLSGVALASPEDTYEDNCAFCHSRAAPPFVGPELRGRALPPIMIKTFVRNGAKGMITFSKAAIDDAELDALAAWIQQSPEPKMPIMPPMPQQGAKP